MIELARIHTNRQISTNALDSTNEPLFQFSQHARCFAKPALFTAAGNHLGALGAGEKIHEVNHAILMNRSCLQNARRRQVLLFSGASELRGWRDVKVAAFFFIEEATKHGWRVKIGPVGLAGVFNKGLASVPAHEIHAAINANQSAGVHIPNHSVVFDRQITTSVLTAGMPRVGRMAGVHGG